MRWQTQELRRHNDLSGYVWTELYDIEHEMAGVYTYARGRKDLGGADPALANAPTTLVVHIEPVEPGRDLIISNRFAEVSLQVSHHGTSPLEGTVSWLWVPPMAKVGMTDLQAALHTDPSHDDGPTISVKPFHLSDATTITAELPPGTDSGRLCLIFSETGTALAGAVVDVNCQPPTDIGQ